MNYNHLYTIASRESVKHDNAGYSNSGGDFWKGVFGSMGSGRDSDGRVGSDGRVEKDGKGWTGEDYAAVGTTLLGLAGGWLEKRRARKEQEGSGIYTYTPPPPPPPPPNNTALYVIGGVAVVGIGVAIYLATKKK